MRLRPRTRSLSAIATPLHPTYLLLAKIFCVLQESTRGSWKGLRDWAHITRLSALEKGRIGLPRALVVRHDGLQPEVHGRDDGKVQASSSHSAFQKLEGRRRRDALRHRFANAPLTVSRAVSGCGLQVESHQGRYVSLRRLTGTARETHSHREQAARGEHARQSTR